MRYYSIVILLFMQFAARAQYTQHPDSSRFVTTDIPLFWKAFDQYKQDTSINPFQTLYLEPGSDGVKGFIPNRIKSADHLYKVVKQRTADYEAIRNASLLVKASEPACRTAFHKLKSLYPEAQYPPVYFVIGAFNSGGTFEEAGVFVGVEVQSNPRQLPFLVAHETIHYQQKTWSEYPSLLQQSIIEGAADFLGEMISGGTINAKAFAYGNQHEEKLCKEFVARMDKNEFTDWLYGVSGKDDRPNDLGYWIGYKIVAAYYAKAADKKQAIKDILWVTDYKDLLTKSGYLSKYL
jgi:hypothetical protein